MSTYSSDREARLEYGKQYRQNNVDKIKEGKARYRADPANKEKEKIYAKQWREEHKTYINEKIKCDNCGCIVSRNSMHGHKKSKKCKEFNTQ